MNNINLFPGAGKMLCAACAIFAQVGCAGPQVTALDVEIARHQAEAQRACWAAQQLPAFSDARDAALVMMARAISGSPCKTTNVYEARAQIAAAQNQAAGQIVGTVATAGIAATGIIAGADLMKAALKNSGASIVGDNNIVTRAEGSASAAGPDMSTTTTTTTTHHGPGRPEAAK